MPSLVDAIVQEHELKNEKAISIVRFVLVSAVAILDLLDLFRIISYRTNAIDPTMLLFDFSFVLLCGIFVLILLARRYFRAIKFFALLIDYSFLTLFLLYGPQVANKDSAAAWVALVGVLALYFLALLRYSKGATVFAAFLSVGAFCFVNFYRIKTDWPDFVALSVILGTMLCIGYFVTTSSRKIVLEADENKTLARFLPLQSIDEFSAKDFGVESNAINREVTILFFDIRSFSALFETMNASDVVRLLNEYLSALTSVVFEQRGTIDRLIGSAAVTIFGAPVQEPDDVVRSVRTAISMTRALKDFNRIHSDILPKPLEIGVGIHSGETVVATVGTQDRSDYAALGETVDLSSKIAGLTKYYRCEILISESTYATVRAVDSSHEFVVREVDRIFIKGKSKSITIYQIMTFDSDSQKIENRSIKERFEDALIDYKTRRFKTACEKFQAIESDALSRLFLDRCRVLAVKPPPPNWDGSFKVGET